MGTRATYEIDGAVFYCHFDGYPQGAAVRFAAMVDKLHEVTDYGTIRNNGGGMDYAFIRGADDAQPTTSHEAHGDAEYRYICYRTTTGAVLTVHARKGWNGNGTLFTAARFGHLLTPTRRTWKSALALFRLVTAAALELW